MSTLVICGNTKRLQPPFNQPQALHLADRLLLRSFPSIIFGSAAEKIFISSITTHLDPGLQCLSSRLTEIDCNDFIGFLLSGAAIPSNNPLGVSHIVYSQLA